MLPATPYSFVYRHIQIIEMGILKRFYKFLMNVINTTLDCELSHNTIDYQKDTKMILFIYFYR